MVVKMVDAAASKDESYEAAIRATLLAISNIATCLRLGAVGAASTY
jgi:hypothetical protein